MTLQPKAICTKCGKEIIGRHNHVFYEDGDKKNKQFPLCSSCFSKKRGVGTPSFGAVRLTKKGRNAESSIGVFGGKYCYGPEGKGPESCGLFLTENETVCPRCGGEISGPEKPESKSILKTRCSRYWEE